ncbi:hypothetical protein D0Y65_011650 [Glycine soja]|uniref:Uncharacterized protein n=1 Tax=Glycine soja TaxID=3848 RepID=A0A445KLB9_GLYSO|nr:hypothetical protein D0Y65_011650 [Glycine soja]
MVYFFIMDSQHHIISPFAGTSSLPCASGRGDFRRLCRHFYFSSLHNFFSTIPYFSSFLDLIFQFQSNKRNCHCSQ